MTKTPKLNKLIKDGNALMKKKCSSNTNHDKVKSATFEIAADLLMSKDLKDLLAIANEDPSTVDSDIEMDGLYWDKGTTSMGAVLFDQLMSWLSFELHEQYYQGNCPVCICDHDVCKQCEDEDKKNEK